MSNPAVIFGCSLLPSIKGRSSFHIGPLEPVKLCRLLRVLRMGVRPSHLIFGESSLQAVRFINRTPKTGQAQRQQIVS
jgi:hypothetical protein